MRKKNYLSGLKYIVSLLAIIAVTLPMAGYSAKGNKSPDKNIIKVQPPDMIIDDQDTVVNDKNAGLQYIPGEFIIKFNSKAGEILRGKLDSNLNISPDNTGISSIHILNKKHKVRSMKPVFTGLHKQLKKGKSIKSIEDEIKRKFPKRATRGQQNAKPHNLENIYKIKVSSEEDIQNIMADYKKDPQIEFAEPDYIVKTNFIPNDPYYASSNSWGQGYDDMWGLKNIQAEMAWDLARGDGIVTAVIDTGLDYNHPDIQGNVWVNPWEIANNGIDDDNNGYIDDINGWDFSTYDGAVEDNDPMDDNGHGTHVSGTIAAVGNNGTGLIGVAPGTKIMPIKGLGTRGYGYMSDLSNALYYAASRGADVINNSWGGGGTSSLIETAVNYAHALGAVVVVSAGNSNGDVMNQIPANIINAIAVASVDQNDIKSYFSNWGTKVDITAPGGGTRDNDPTRKFENILSLRANGTDIYGDGINIVGTQYYRLRGTSMSAPHVSGLAALILSLRPDFTNEEVRQVLRSSADDIGDPGFDINNGFGRINAFKALQVNSVCLAGIDSPERNLLTGAGSFQINGTASCPDFQSYKLEYSTSLTGTWTQIGSTATSPVTKNQLGTWTVDVTGDYYLRLTVTDQNNNDFLDITGPVFVDAERHEGWPFDTGSMVLSSPQIIDTDNDGNKELVFISYEGILFFMNADGTEKFTIDLNSSYAYSTPAFADFDGDGDLDMVVTFIKSAFSSRLNYYENIGAGFSLGFSSIINNDVYSSPIIKDLDGDGRYEIIIGALWGAYPYNLNNILVFDDQGTTLFATQFADKLIPNMAVGDTDGDGDKEIIAGGYYDPEGPGNTGLLQGWHHDGTPFQGSNWPIIKENYSFGNVIIKENPDGQAEIYANGNTQLYIVDGNGNHLGGSPINLISTFKGGPTIGINEFDERLIYVNHAARIESYTLQGSKRWGTSGSGIPLGPPIFSNPIVLDINNGTDKLIISSYSPSSNLLTIADDSGNVLSVKRTNRRIISTPAAGDLDSDGYLELAVGSEDGKVYVWDLDTFYQKSMMEWPQFQHDLQHTGKYSAIPKANAGGHQNVSDSDNNGEERVTLDGSGSSDDDGPIASYLWKEGETTLGTFAVISSNLRVGTHLITLIVTDEDNISNTDSVSIVVNANQPPIADAGLYPPVPAGDQISFNGSASSDADGSITAYDWDFGDNSSGTGITRAHSYASSGSYTVTLTVTDNGNMTDSDTFQVSVVDLIAPTNLIASERVMGKGKNLSYMHDLSWDTVAGAVEYSIYRSSSSSGPWNYLDRVTTNSYSYKAGSASTLYFYVLQASDGSAWSPFSNWGASDGTSGVTGPLPPLAITTDSLPDGSVNYYYSTTLQAEGGNPPYTWAISDGTLPDGLTLDPGAGTISGTPTTIGSQTLSVQALDAVFTSHEKQLSINIIDAPPAPIPPANLSATIRKAGKNYRADLGWDKNVEPDLAGYKVYKSIGRQGGPYNLIQTINDPAQTVFTDSGLSSGTFYYYVVTAFNNMGQESGYSNEVELVP